LAKRVADSWDTRWTGGQFDNLGHVRPACGGRDGRSEKREECTRSLRRVSNYYYPAYEPHPCLRLRRGRWPRNRGPLASSCRVRSAWSAQSEFWRFAH